MIRRTTTPAVRLFSVALAFFLAMGIVLVLLAKFTPSILGIDSDSTDTQVIQAIERTQEISLVSLQIQGLREETTNREVFGRDLPGSGEKVLLQYAFTAKLGVDGEGVNLSKTGDRVYLISVPRFTFIGHADPTFKTAAESGGVLRWLTPDIDKARMVTAILNDKAREKYVAENEELLQDQTKYFYDSLIKSIDPTLETRYEFSS